MHIDLAKNRFCDTNLKIGFLFFLFVTTFALTSCKKKPEGEISITTKAVTDITENSAKCGGSVSFTGGFTIEECGICYSEDSYPTVSYFYTEDSYGTGSFNSTLSNLISGTKYYVRAYARTSSGIKYGNQESFTTKENGTWMLYGDDTWKNRWGLTNGGTLTWAVMFPSSMLSAYDGTKITKVKICAGEKGTYTVKIYKGGATSPTTLLMSKDYSVTSTGLNTLEISPLISLTTSQNLWISVTNTHEAGEHPAGASEGINNPNARWRCYNGSWEDEIEHNGNTDLCWMIQVLLSDTRDKNDKEIEISMPQSSEETHFNTSFHKSSVQTDIPNNGQSDCIGIN